MASQKGCGCFSVSCLCNRGLQQKLISDRIDGQIKEDKKIYEATFRITLVGTDGSGKTTIINQMRILHSNGFNDKEKQQKMEKIRNNIREAIITILEAMSTLLPPVQLEHRENQKSVDWIEKYANNPKFEYSSEFYEHVEALWKDSGVLMTYERSNEYQLMECAQYFLDQVNTIKQPDYTPTEQDILRCYDFNKIINDVHFKLDYVNFHLYDLRHHLFTKKRHRWHYILRETAAIIFVTDSSSENSLEDSLNFFRNFWRKRFVYSVNFILFLNKQDLLSKKILADKSKLEDYFVEFKTYRTPVDALGDPNESPVVTRAKYFILDQFMKLTKDRYHYKHFYSHFTCALDTENIQGVFNDCRDNIQQTYQRQHKLL